LVAGAKRYNLPLEAISLAGSVVPQFYYALFHQIPGMALPEKRYCGKEAGTGNHEPA